jgi:hypothetical protein
MRVLKIDDVRSLLRAEIELAGGVVAWSKKAGVHRTTVSKVAANLRPPTKSIIKALRLRTVFVADYGKAAN